ncbi:hypothetical protein ONZ45_g4051 [Pleurotus djamor]|nr:hypothetical protein ONZ45_g4051 [Pleurotus djamor]
MLSSIITARHEETSRLFLEQNTILTPCSKPPSSTLNAIAALMEDPQSLPPELWRHIIQELDSPHRNDLHPLLTVCRVFYDVVVRRIYETILVDGYTSIHHYGLIKWGNEPSTRLDISRISLLRTTLEDSPALARMVMSFIDVRYSIVWSHRSSTRPILPHLVNLRRLHITRAEEDDMLALPSSIILTHLSIPFTPTTKPLPFKALLDSQRRALTFLRGELAEPLEFLPSSMASLHTFACDNPHLWDQFVEVAPIRHLSSTAFRTARIHDPQLVFSNLVSLSIVPLAPNLAMSRVGGYLTSLRLLQVIVQDYDMDSPRAITRSSIPAVTIFSFTPSLLPSNFVVALNEDFACHDISGIQALAKDRDDLHAMLAWLCSPCFSHKKKMLKQWYSM